LYLQCFAVEFGAQEVLLHCKTPKQLLCLNQGSLIEFSLLAKVLLVEEVLVQVPAPVITDCLERLRHGV